MNGKAAVWIVVGVLGALVLGFVGGIVGSTVLGPKGGDTSALARDLGALQARVQGLETRVAALPATAPATPGTSLRIGVVNAEDLFTRVFLPQVATERAALQTRVAAIQDLQARYARGELRPEAYQKEYAKLQAEYLQAQVRVNMAMLDKMIASPGFANLRADLTNLRNEAKPLADQVDALVRQAQVVILNPTDFLAQVQQLQAAFQQVDQLLTQVAAVKILEVAQLVGMEQGFDLVLRVRDVVMYQRAPAVVDLTPEVERRLAGLFPTR